MKAKITKPVVKQAPTKVAVATKPVAAPAAKSIPVKKAPAKTIPVAKPKLVRDSFTIPKDEYQVLGDLKARMTKLMQPAKKSELLRAGLKALAAMSDVAIKKALQNVPAIKTGRPKETA